MRELVRAMGMTIALWLAATAAQARETVEFNASDELLVTADVYELATGAKGAWIVLAHQAGASRGEYRDIAPELNALGYNAIAIDQRSGKSFGGVFNETAQRAKEAETKADYLDAIPDIAAGIAYARAQGATKVILWGSSYSAALALAIAGENPDLVDAVVAMSPGEYLKGLSVTEASSKITAPVLMVSPPDEKNRWEAMLAAVPHDQKTGFAPETGGVHGSSALIEGFSPNPEPHWAVVKAFLARYAPPK